MQKVVYVLLQQHAERYWQADHDDESEDDTEDTYSGIKSSFFSLLLLLIMLKIQNYRCSSSSLPHNWTPN